MLSPQELEYKRELELKARSHYMMSSSLVAASTTPGRRTLAVADGRWPCARPTWHLAEGLPSQKAPGICTWGQRSSAPCPIRSRRPSRVHRSLTSRAFDIPTSLQPPSRASSHTQSGLFLAEWPISRFRMPPCLLVSQRTARAARALLLPSHGPLAALPMLLGRGPPWHVWCLERQQMCPVAHSEPKQENLNMSLG